MHSVMLLWFVLLYACVCMTCIIPLSITCGLPLSVTLGIIFCTWNKKINAPPIIFAQAEIFSEHYFIFKIFFNLHELNMHPVYICIWESKHHKLHFTFFSLSGRSKKSITLQVNIIFTNWQHTHLLIYVYNTNITTVLVKRKQF